MSIKKSFFQYTVFFIVATVLIISAIILIIPNSESEMVETVYEESEEVLEFFNRFERNRQEAQVSLEESRVIASNWIKKEHSKINRHLFYRRRAYDLISRSILKVDDYNDLNYQLSRLPSTEKQAYTTLTVDRSSITTLDSYLAYIPSLAFPIQLPGKINNGMDLLISSAYSSKRVSPVGAGGSRPHFAVDVINIGNIDYINKEGELIRDGNHPGYIVSAADGIVTNIEYNHTYGWNVTVEHDRSLIPAGKRSGVKSFETFYAHLDELIYVNIGDRLSTSQNIALVGNSGLSTGPHLHYEIRMIKNDGTKYHVNPYPGSEW